MILLRKGKFDKFNYADKYLSSSILHLDINMKQKKFYQRHYLNQETIFFD